jgi:hypothetical protein
MDFLRPGFGCPNRLAHFAGDLVAAADAFGDRPYVLLGDAVAASLPAAAIFAEIHRSNMTKAGPSASGNGKGSKGAAFMPPQLGGLLGGGTE